MQRFAAVFLQSPRKNIRTTSNPVSGMDPLYKLYDLMRDSSAKEAVEVPLDELVKNARGHMLYTALDREGNNFYLLSDDGTIYTSRTNKRPGIKETPVRARLLPSMHYQFLFSSFDDWQREVAGRKGILAYTQYEESAIFDYVMPHTHLVARLPPGKVVEQVLASLPVAQVDVGPFMLLGREHFDK